MEPETPVTPAPTPVATPTPRGSSSKIATLIITVVASALVAGGAVYFYEKHQQTNANQALQAQIDTLQSQVNAQPTATPTPTPTATPTASASPTATTTATSACLANNLKLSLVDNGGGTAGTDYLNIVLTNIGTQSCTVSGFPKVALLDGTGAVLGNATDSASVTASNLTVAASAAVYAAVGFPDPGNFPAGTCSAAATSLSVTPPGTTTALTIAATQPYCPGFSISALSATKL